MRGMKVPTEDFVVGEVIKNLLRAQHVAAEDGDCAGAIKIARHLVKLSKKYRNSVIDFSAKKER